ncbi:MAG: polysaccharide biosynthesis C-terminal domain-containing protein, partial [Desulfobacterales bacterium]
FVFNLLTVVFFFALGRPLLGLVFGAVFVNSYLPLVILMAGQMVNSAAGSVAFLLNMTGHERDTAKGVACAAGINIVLNLILIPPLGINGAATATAVSMVVWNVLLWWMVRKRLRINSMAFNLNFREKL